jgi:hypothetical protein
VDFYPETALAYARDLAYPRRVGTPGEAAAIDGLDSRLAAAGYQVTRESFEFSAGAQVVTTLEILGAQTLILLTFWAWGLSAFAGAVPALVLLALLGLTGRLQRLVAAASIAPPPGAPRSLWQRLCVRLGDRQRTVNLVARLPEVAPTDHDRPHLYLVAHSDSKSQALPLTARMLLIALAGLAAAAFAVLSVLRPLWPSLTSPAAILGLVALLVGVPVLFLFLAGAGNASPGAIDNASGAGLVVHLAEVLAARRPEVNLTILITGAEELGVVGATAFVLAAQASGKLKRQSEAGGVFILNFDGIGIEGRLALVRGRKESNLAKLVHACCVELQLPLGRLPLVGAMFDHIPFAETGCDALSLVTIGPAARSIHTPADSADRLHISGFRQAGEVALRVLEKLAVSMPEEIGN